MREKDKGRRRSATSFPVDAKSTIHLTADGDPDTAIDGKSCPRASDSTRYDPVSRSIQNEKNSFMLYTWVCSFRNKETDSREILYTYIVFETIVSNYRSPFHSSRNKKVIISTKATPHSRGRNQRWRLVKGIGRGNGKEKRKRERRARIGV